MRVAPFLLVLALCWSGSVSAAPVARGVHEGIRASHPAVPDAKGQDVELSVAPKDRAFASFDEVLLTPPGGPRRRLTATRARLLAPPPAAPAAPQQHAPADEHEDEGPEWSLLPVAEYTPETSVGAGAVFLFLFRPPGTLDPKTRPSVIESLLIGTVREQLIFELQPDLYLFDEWLWIWSILELSIFPDQYYGIGNDVTNDFEIYNRRTSRFRTWPRITVWKELQVGALLDIYWFKATYEDESGDFATQDVPGEDGGLNVGIGPSLTWDTRDSTVGPRKGALYQLGWEAYPTFIGSDYDFHRLSLDVRHYWAFYGTNVIANRVYLEQHFGDVPYYQLAKLGGRDLLRGYYEGRFRDKAMAVAELEYRSPLWWRLGAVVFGGVGIVGERLDQFDFANHTRWAVGTGGRFALSLKERLNIRADVAVGPDTFGFYISAREIF